MSDEEVDNVPIVEDSDEKINKSGGDGTQEYDYKKILEDMKKELEQIPAKFPEGKADDEVNKSRESQKKEQFELNRAGTTEL